MNKQLIITADDYGLCAPVNDAIEECLAAGVTRATCVMTNMPEYAQAAQLRKKFPDCSVGIHWNLTQGRPVLSPALVPSLVNPDGMFFRSLRQRWLAGKINLTDILAELRAQYMRFREVASNPDFWNTHQDSHIWPGLFHTFVDAGKELAIPAMRSHRRFTVPLGSSWLRYHMRHPVYWAKGEVIARWSDEAEAKQTAMPAGRIYTPGCSLDSSSFQEALNRIGWERVQRPLELAIHPATRVEAALFGSLTQSRIRDYELFRNPRLRDRLQQIGVRPVGFEALRQNRSFGRHGVAA